LDPDAGPKCNGSSVGPTSNGCGYQTQQKWVWKQDPRFIGPTQEPIKLGHVARLKRIIIKIIIFIIQIILFLILLLSIVMKIIICIPQIIIFFILIPSIIIKIIIFIAQIIIIFNFILQNNYMLFLW